MSWRRIALLSLALVTVLAVVTWALLQHSGAATALVRRELVRLLQGRAELESTQVELTAGRLDFRGLRVGDPTQPERDLLRVASGHVGVQAAPFAGGVALRHVLLEGLAIEAGPTFPRPDQLLRQEVLDGGGGGGPGRLPAVEIRGGTARLHLRQGEQPLELAELSLIAGPADGADEQLVVRGSASLQQPKAPLTIEGQVDITGDGGWLSLRADDFEVSPATLLFLTRLLQVDPQRIEAGGRVQQLTVLCELPRRADPVQVPRFTVQLRCEDIAVTAPGLPPLVRHAGLELFVDTAGSGRVAATVSQQDEDGAIRVGVQLDDLAAPHFALRAEGRDVRVTDEVLTALRSFKVGADVVRALQPTQGRADVDLYLRDPHLPRTDVDLDLDLREVAMAFAGFGPDQRRIGFPLPLEAARGKVRLRDNVILLQGLSASIAAHAGGGRVTLEGRIEVLEPLGEDTSLDIHSDRVAFSPDLRRALAQLLGEEGASFYDRLKPEGQAEVDVRVRPMKRLPGGFRVLVRPLDAKMLWAGFPYELAALAGEIVVHEADARFELTGRHGSGGLSMRGRIPLHQQHPVGQGFEAVVDLEHLAVDDALREAVAKITDDLDEPWRLAAPTGALSGRVKVSRPKPEDPLQHDVRLLLEDVDLTLPVAPWHAAGLNGQVLAQGDGVESRVDFETLRGELTGGESRPSRLALLGRIQSGEATRHDLAFVVQDLELTPQLDQTLQQLGALDDSVWDSLRPSGRVDLVCRDAVDDARRHDLQVFVQLVDVRSEAPMLPQPAEHMTGELHIENGKLTFKDVRADMGSTRVRCWDGRVEPLPGDGRTEIHFAVNAPGFEVDDGLANLVSGPLHQAVLDRQLRGHADVDDLRLTFRVPTGDSKAPFETKIQGNIALDGVDVRLGSGPDGVQLHDLHGVATIDESTVTDAGGQLRGTLRRAAMTLFGHRLEAFEGQFVADAEQLAIGTLTTRLADGVLRNRASTSPAVIYRLPTVAAPQGSLATDLAFEGVDVFTLLSQSGWANPPYSGSASGQLRLDRLEGADVVGAAAAGSLHVERADLGKVPLFTAIYAQLPPSEQPRFNHLDVDFRLVDQQLEIDNLEVRSDILAAKGAGTLDLDGYLDVRMDLDNLLGSSADPLVMPLIDYLAGNLVRFHLFGYVRDLRAEPRLLTERSPRRRPVLPMPPARERPASPGY
ncbi:MAG: hypothetical protein H6835_07935 [Planctomycetes bacterium]|nr:hypothetical protein [Planctomycetota bacterium]